MSIPEKNIPVRCLTCTHFSNDRELLSGHKRFKDDAENRPEEIMEYYGYDREELGKKLAQAVESILSIREDIEKKLVYTVGCPGVDLHEDLQEGQPAHMGECQSPFINPRE